MDTSARPDNIPYPGPAWRPSVAYANTSAIARLITSPDMVLAEWHQSAPNPNYLDSQNRPIENQTEFIRTIVANSSRPDGYWPIIVGAEEQMIRYYKQGTWEDGTLPITYYATDLPLAPFDWLIPFGVDGICDAITFPHRENLMRGSKNITGPGSVSNIGTAVTGTNTVFTNLFSAGDILQMQNMPYVIASVTDNTHLTLIDPPSQNLTGFPYAKLLETLLYPPVTKVTLLQDSNNIVYQQGVAFNIGLDNGSIQWLSPSNQPAYGVRYGIAYQYRPIYELTDLGRKRRLSGGLKQLDIQSAKVWKPEHITS